MVGRALQADKLVRLTMQALDQSFQQAGFSDPRLAAHKHHLALAALGQLPAIEEDADFAVAADELREGLAARRIEATFHVAFARDAEHRHTVLKALELVGTEIFVLESMARQAAGIVRDDDLARLQRPEGVRRDWRLARHMAAVERPASGKIAHDHAATRDPNA